MNALAMTATNPLNALLAMSVAPRVSQASGRFPGLVDLAFDSPAPNTLSVAPSQKIADALIRSMMAGPAIFQGATAPQVNAAVRNSIPSDRAQPTCAARPNKISNPVSNNDAAAEPQASAPLVNESAETPNGPVPNSAEPESTPAPAIISPQIKPEPQTIAPAAVTSAMPKVKTEVRVPADETGAVKTNGPVRNQAAIQASPVRVQPSQAQDAPANASPSLDGRVKTQSMTVPAPAQQPANVTHHALPWQSFDTPIAASTAAPAPAEQPVAPELKDTPDSIRTESDPYEAGSTQDVEQSEAQSVASIGACARNQAQNKRAAIPAPVATSSSVKSGPPVASPSKTTETAKLVSGDDSSAEIRFAQPAQYPAPENRTPDPACTTALPAPIVRATVVPAALPDVNIAPETSAAADSDSTISTQQTGPVSSFAGAPSAPAPVAFSALLTPVSDSSAATPSPLPSAAKETAPVEVPFSFAASFSTKPVSMKPAGDESATPANTPKNGNAPTPVPAPKSREEQSKDNATPVTPADGASQSGDFSQATQSAMVIAADKPAAPETTHVSSPAPAASDSTQAARVPEPPVAASAPTPSAPVQQIAVRIPQAGGAPVDLQITERGGEIHVSVRTADTAMQTSLRQDLGTLSNSLERAGYRAEMFTPREASATPAAREMQTSTNLRDERDPSGSGGRNGSGNPQQGRQQQSSQQSLRDQRQKSWLEELENSK